MKSVILGLILVLTSCATTTSPEPPSMRAEQQGLCIEGDIDCGAPGTNPNDAAAGWVDTNYPSSDINAISCFTVRDLAGRITGYQCHVSFSWGGFEISVGCAWWVDSEPECFVDE